jgi:hypothetical protein
MQLTESSKCEMFHYTACMKEMRTRTSLKNIKESLRVKGVVMKGWEFLDQLGDC